MVTLMRWQSSGGKKGRCDAKCHNAKSASCHCMCGGRYHGGARDGTLEQRVDQYAEEILTAAQQRAEAEGLKLEALGADEMLAAIRERRAWRKRRKETTARIPEPCVTDDDSASQTAPSCMAGPTVPAGVAGGAVA